jgi:hypothetical protein
MPPAGFFLNRARSRRPNHLMLHCATGRTNSGPLARAGVIYLVFGKSRATIFVAPIFWRCWALGVYRLGGRQASAEIPHV